jgi:hypothetical protein
MKSDVDPAMDLSVYLELAQLVYADACAKCTADVSDLRDLMTMRSRAEHEGVSFLTLTLPTFARDLEKSLASGYVAPTDFACFRKSGAIPAFMQGMLGQLFDQGTGRIRDETNDTPVVIEAVRQVCNLFKKTEIPCSPERESAAVENFVAIERSFDDFTLHEADAAEFSAVSALLWDGMLADLQPDVLLPRHGPGATVERKLGNQKYVWRYWHDRVESVFPFFGGAYPLTAAGEDIEHEVTFVPEDEEPPVRVTLVPKTLKGPRVIAVEPVCMQYVQQAIQSELYRRIGSWWLSAGHVNFDDQSINQQLALTSSKDGRFATIDLSDASDRVPHDLAMTMFNGNPMLRDAVEACRSRYAITPDGRIIGPLRKFASMGSALCFPVESMYFYTICVAARLRLHNLPATLANVHHVTRELYCYGDDIIVPTAEADTILGYLQKYNCKVNVTKSFWSGKFRESCGMDAYNGESVTPTYIRRLRPENRQQVDRIVSWVATANLFYQKGYWRTAAHMFAQCERIVGPLPYVSPTSSSLGRVSFMGYRTVERWSRTLHRFEHRGLKPSLVYRSDSIDGYSALTKCLLSLERREPSEDPLTDEDRFENASASEKWSRWQKGIVTPLAAGANHLERTAQRGAATLKRRWVPST